MDSRFIFSFLAPFYLAIPNQRQRNDCCAGRLPASEMTVSLVNLYAKAKAAVATSKLGWGQGASRGMWAWDDVSSHTKFTELP